MTSTMNSNQWSQLNGDYSHNMGNYTSYRYHDKAGKEIGSVTMVPSKGVITSLCVAYLHEQAGPEASRIRKTLLKKAETELRNKGFIECFAFTSQGDFETYREKQFMLGHGFVPYNYWWQFWKSSNLLHKQLVSPKPWYFWLF